MTVKYPEINVKLVGEDGNAFFILGRCRSAMKKAGLSQDETSVFSKEAKSGNYDHLLSTVMEWFNTDDDSEDYDENYNNYDVGF